ncbi:MAG TPA: hypothetical protein K8V15_01860 [Tessaracoccus flavescens]|uniref:DUF3180 domain-containing protein n=1 Tax=Tessaracoccus flavescens TaxID=399497 RepID=A0A921JQ61_9ACTN|nr:hypothetical protein [Tessaracoccus flavescens]
MDERQELNAGRASMIVLGLIALVALGVLVYEYVTTKDVNNGWAILTLLGSGGMLALLMRMIGGAEAPKTFLGKELPTEDTSEAKAERKRAYLIDAGLFAIAIAALSVVGLTLGDTQAIVPAFLQGTAGMIVGAALSLVGGFVIYYAFNYVVGESASRSVEKRLARYDAE